MGESYPDNTPRDKIKEKSQTKKRTKQTDACVKCATSDGALKRIEIQKALKLRNGRRGKEGGPAGPKVAEESDGPTPTLAKNVKNSQKGCPCLRTGKNKAKKTKKLKGQ